MPKGHDAAWFRNYWRTMPKAKKKAIQQKKADSYRRWRRAQTFGDATLNKIDRKYFDLLRAIYDKWMTDRSWHLEHRRLSRDSSYIMEVWEKFVRDR